MSTKLTLTDVNVSNCCASDLSVPLDRNDAVALARVLKAAADPTRLQLLSLIAASGQACACDLNDPVGLSQPTVSHHLKVLTDAGLIIREQRGTWAWFRINPTVMQQLGDTMSSVGARTST